MSTEESTKTQAQEIAAALRQIADAVEPLDLPTMYAGLTLTTTGVTDDAVKVAAIDAVAVAVAGKPGSTRAIAGGVFHHESGSRVGVVRVTAFDQVASPEERARVAELAELRAKVAELEAAKAGLEAHWRIYRDAKTGAPVAVCVPDSDYPHYDPTRFLSPDAYDTEAEAVAAIESFRIAGDEYGEWLITAYHIPNDAANCRVELRRSDRVVREFPYPAYKVWTLLAHWKEAPEVLAADESLAAGA